MQTCEPWPLSPDTKAVVAHREARPFSPLDPSKFDMRPRKCATLVRLSLDLLLTRVVETVSRARYEVRGNEGLLPAPPTSGHG